MKIVLDNENESESIILSGINSTHKFWRSNLYSVRIVKKTIFIKEQSSSGQIIFESKM